MSQGFNFSHLRKMPIEGEPWQAQAIYYYFLPPGTAPTFIVDVSEHFEDWRRRSRCTRRSSRTPRSRARPASAPANILDWFEVYARKDAMP